MQSVQSQKTIQHFKEKHSIENFPMFEFYLRVFACMCYFGVKNPFLEGGM